MDGETEGSSAIGGFCQWGHLHLGNNDNKNNKMRVYFFQSAILRFLCYQLLSVSQTAYAMSHLYISFSLFLYCPRLSFLDVYYYESTNLLLTFTFTVVRTVSTTQQVLNKCLCIYALLIRKVTVNQLQKCILMDFYKTKGNWTSPYKDMAMV